MTTLYFLVLVVIGQIVRSGTEHTNAVEEDWGDGLKVLSIHKPQECEHRAKQSDVIHYHYVGRLASDGSVFGKSFDYKSPYIVALGHGRIIPGMDRGLMGTCLWERRRISFPPHLGYGERGVGTTIPPNSSLVFYVRLIKIERNGHVLGEDGDMVELWNSGLASYTAQNWQGAVDMMEEALRLYHSYKNETLLCIKQCYREISLENLSKKMVKSDPSVEQFFLYGVRGKCMSKCKQDNLPPTLRNPDPAVMEKFSRNVPYSYLHYAYYQMGEFEMAASSCFTFLHYNPSDQLALSSVPFYRHKLNLTTDEFIYRDMSIELHQKSYIKGKQVYNEGRWLEAVDLFENSLEVYKEGLQDCYLLCEDVVHLNLSEPNVNTMKKKLLDEYGFKSDTMEYYELLQMSIKEILQCRIDCFNRLCHIQGQLVEDYLSSHFNYLQFSYFKLGNIYKASEAAATYLALEPSSDTMTTNIQFYSSTYNLSSESLVPRKEFVDAFEIHQMNKRLVHFAEHGKMKKREGQRGDTGEQRPAHEEL